MEGKGRVEDKHTPDVVAFASPKIRGNPRGKETETQASEALLK